MSNSYSRLDQAIRDLIEAYAELEEELESKYADDEDAYSHAIIETLETSLESAIEEQDSTTAGFASMLTSFSEALEQLDPSAFEEDEDEVAYDLDDVDYDIDDDEDDEDIDDE